ncbi:hypothetical protein ACEWY4_000899 [Coilia grayii]|uniref:MyoD family inhibitor domain containing 2 n=1 Tax=Coilia grayii TaxID=363190 RepID=A0ABD1KYE9_9TELE
MDGKSAGNGTDPSRDGKGPVTDGMKCSHHEEVVVCGIRRLSTISEKDADMDAPSVPCVHHNEWAGSNTTLLSSDKYLLSSGFTSFDSLLPDPGDDCASLLLACLHCRFSELLSLVPVTCERALVRCCPSCRYFSTSSEPIHTDTDCCSCNVNCDCSLMNSCQDASELLELAMEVSEVCYR